VPVLTTRAPDGTLRATLTSVAPHVDPVAAEDLAEALAALGWPERDLDPALPPRVAYAGARHLVLAAATRARLAALDYDVPRLRALMEAQGWTTVALLWRESERVLHARDPFPVGGVYEDPATGAAAAAVGAYLRELGLVTPPAELTIHQGQDMGRPGTLHVTLRAGVREVEVSGTAVEI
jgi:PhzF family phenazine biosynthesis protein